MKIEKISWEKKNNKLSFILKDTEEGFANTIRRLVIEEVPTLAVEEVEIKENSSILYDEMIALRLGLSPIKTDLDSYELKKECKCEGKGCARCELKMTLKGGKKGYLYATDAESHDPQCKFIYPIPIVKLLPKQKVELQMTAVLGKGKAHAKWVPGWIWFFGWPEFKTTGKSRLEALSKCPALEIKGSQLKIKDITRWDSASEELCEKNQVEVIPSETDLVFNLESWGQLNCKEILNKAADLFLEKLDQFESLL